MRLLVSLASGLAAAVLVTMLLSLGDGESAGRGAISLLTFIGVAWFVNRRRQGGGGDAADHQAHRDLRQLAPDGSVDIGAGVWRRVSGWEVVRVWHHGSSDRFYFATDDHFTYGANVGGYGRRELATLYMQKKLSLSPERLAAVDPSAEVAVIENQFGQPVLAALDWDVGLDPLLADPDFHATEP